MYYVLLFQVTNTFVFHSLTFLLIIIILLEKMFYKIYYKMKKLCKPNQITVYVIIILCKILWTNQKKKKSFTY